MATLPYNTTNSSHFHGAANRISIFSHEAVGFGKHKRQALPITYLKSRSLVSVGERANTWKLSDIAECATEAKLEYMQLTLEELTELKADYAPQSRQDYEQVSSEVEAEHEPEVAFLQGFDKRLRDKMNSQLRASEANQDAFSRMAVEVGSAILQVDYSNATPQNGAHSHHENLSQSLRESWQSRSKVSDSSIENSFQDSIEEGSMNSETSLLHSELGSPLSVESREQPKSSKVNASSSPSAVVLKKPITVSRQMFEKEVSGMTNPPGNVSENNEDSSELAVSKDSGLLDLTTGLQALRRLIFRKHFDLAEDLAKKLYGQYPGDTDVLMEYAFVQRQRGDLVAAGALYSQAISSYKDQNNLGYDYVRALQALGSIEANARNARRARAFFMESIHAAHQAERLFPGTVSGASVYGLHAWARLEEKLGNWSKARDLLTRAAEIQPGNAVVHQSRALLEAKAHNWGAARYHFSLAAQAAPNDLKCWHAWAIFESSQGKQQKMRSLFQRALAVDPNSVHCLQAWAHQETIIGTTESKQKARSLFERCVQIEPKSLHSWQAWAVMESASGKYDKARELFKKCLEINPSSVASLQAYATMERKLENWCSAQRLLRKAMRLEPENAAVLMEAAFVEKGLCNMELAETLFVSAGMADKRKSRVRNKVFASRKEVMPQKAGDKLRRAFAKEGLKKSDDFNTIMKAIEAKKKAVESETNVNTEQQSSPRLKQRERGRGVWVPSRSGA